VLGTIAELAAPKKARATPNSTSVAKIGSVERSPDSASATRAIAPIASTAQQIAMMRRRGQRSAAGPVTSTSAKAGRNWARPTSPRSQGSRVMS
jgi:hypothetical protein